MLLTIFNHFLDKFWKFSESYVKGTHKRSKSTLSFSIHGNDMVAQFETSEIAIESGRFFTLVFSPSSAFWVIGKLEFGNPAFVTPFVFDVSF